MIDDVPAKADERRPRAATPLANLPRQLRIDAAEMSGWWGAGNEAEHARQAADEIERLRALLHRHLGGRWWPASDGEQLALYWDTVRGIRGEPFITHGCRGTA